MIGGHLLCIGDSLTFGARDEKGLHYPELLARLLSTTFDQYWTAINHGISGETTPQILRRCYQHVRAYPEASEVFLWAGFNDAKVNVATPPHDYQANMESMVRSILFAGRALYLFTIPKMSGFGAPDFVDNNLIEEYNQRIRAIHQHYRSKGHARFYLVDTRDIPAEYRNDGVHITHRGNLWVAERAFKAVCDARRRQDSEKGQQKITIRKPDADAVDLFATVPVSVGS